LIACPLWFVTSVSAAAKSQAGVTARPPAPETRVTTLDGRSIDLAALQGRVVIVDFWATWCPPCLAEIPHFKALYATYHPRVEILAIAVDNEGESVVAPFVRQQGITYPVILGHDGKLAAAYGGIRGLPTTFVIDRRGRIYKKYVGYQAPEVFERDVTALLAES